MQPSYSGVDPLAKRKLASRKNVVRSKPASRKASLAAPAAPGRPKRPAGKPGRSLDDDDPSTASRGGGDDYEPRGFGVVDFEDEEPAERPVDVAADDAGDEESDSFGDAGGGSAVAIDDPVRIYLMQMGEIPLLSRQQEIACAKQIEATRTAFRRRMLASDFMLRGAVALLEKVRDSELRLDRTIEVSVTNTAEKKRILKRIGPEPGDADPSAQAEPGRLRIAIDRQGRPGLAPRRLAPADSPPQQSGAPGRGAESADAAVAAAVGQAGRNLEADGLDPRADCRAARPTASHRRPRARAAQRAALPDADHAGKPRHAPPPRRPHHALPAAIRRGQARAVGRQPAAGRLHRQALPQPRPELPGPDPGRATRA